MIFLSHSDLRLRGISYSRSQLWRMERAGKFPKRVPIGENRVGWVESEIEGWMKERANARNTTAA